MKLKSSFKVIKWCVERICQILLAGLGLYPLGCDYIRIQVRTDRFFFLVFFFLFFFLSFLGFLGFGEVGC